MNPWTEPRTNRLKKLWKDGWSASIIAADLGDTTRNAVIAKVHRLGLQSRTVRRHLPRLKKNPNMARKHCTKAKPKPVRQPVETAPKPLHLALEDTTPKTCKYPYGNGPYTFCGHETEQGGSWCEYHQGVVFNVV